MTKRFSFSAFGCALMVCALVGTIAADDSTPATPKLATPTAAERRAAWLKKVGGFYEGATKGKSFLYLNCAEIESQVLDNVISQMQQVCGIVLKQEKAELNGPAMDLAKKLLREREDVGAITLFFKGNNDAPIEAIYPMDKVCLINVSAIQPCADKVYSERVTALACRSIAYIAGGAMPFGVEGCMKNLFEAKDIDHLKSKLLHPMSGQLVKSSAPDFGFAQWKRGTYIAACQEGWANPPTNEIQRAIWNEVRTLPKKPLTIQYDPTRGK